MTAVRTWSSIALLCLTATAASAQQETGSLHGTVIDVGGETLPGVAVSLSGLGAEQIQISDALGKFRFLGLDPGDWSLRASLDGFSTVEFPSIDVRAGRNTTLEVQLIPAVQEVISVTSESPLLDERKVSQGSILTQLELEAIPTARDPWAILTQAPGVLVDRVNVGGNESAQQSFFIAPNAEMLDNQYLIDGVETTDSSGGGYSATYYDFDQFSQFELSTGGTEITNLTPGVSLNMVTKRGTNEFRGSARWHVTDADGYLGVLEQGEPSLDPKQLAPGQEEAITGNRIDRNEEYGAEAGGPVLRDRLWLWGAWGETNTNTFAADGQPEAFTLENAAIKLNAQLTSANSLIASWSTGEKTSDSRGAGPARAPETTFRQRGPTDILKVEDTHVLGSSLFLSGAWSEVDMGFQLMARGGIGPEAPEILWDSDGVWKQNLLSGWAERPSEVFQLEGSYFFTAGTSSHELALGGRVREFDLRDGNMYPGRQLVHIAGENWGVEPGPMDFVLAVRAGQSAGRVEYRSAWLQDTMTWGQWTVNAGLRWDLQQTANEPSLIPANPAFPEILPALDYPGDDAGGFDWETVCPRIGSTYALGEERKTLLRASYARFAQQLNGSYATWVNPVYLAYGYFYFLDSNDNNIWDGYEVDGEPVLFASWGFDPADPGALESPNVNDPGLDAPETDELILGVEHSFLPEFVVGLNLTYRHATDLLEQRQLIRDVGGTRRVARRPDFFLEHTLVGELPDGSPYAVDFYALNPGLEDTGGTLTTNGDRTRDYLGATVSATKRLSHRWMLRGYATYGKAEWDIPDSFYRYQDPTDSAGALWSLTQSTQDNDGDVYFHLGGRSGSLMQSSWAFNVSGMVQIAPARPWGFNIAGNLYGREGYPLPYYVSYISEVDGINRRADAVRRADEFRKEDLFLADLRVEKEIAAGGKARLILSIDAFNIFNENIVLRRQLNLTSARPDYVDETVSPRIFRLGARLSWR